MRNILLYILLLFAGVANAQYYPAVGGSFNSTNDLYTRKGADYVYTQVNGIRGGLFWWNPTITAASDSGTIFRVSSISTGAWQRIVTSTIGLNPYMFGAIGDSVTNDNYAVNQAILKAAELKVPMRFPAGNFRVNSTCRVFAKPLYIIWEGGRVIVSGNAIWIDYEAGYFSHDDVESTAVVDTIIDPNAIAPTRTFRLTMPSLNAGIHYGSYVKLTSIDQLPYTDNSQVGSGNYARLGDVSIVVGIVVSGGKTKVYLNSVPEYSEKYVTSVKLHGIDGSKLTMEGRGSIEAMDGGDTLGFANPFMRIRNAYNVDLSGVNFLRQYQPAIHLYSVYFSRIRMMNFGVGKTQAGERVSYGIRDNACEHNDYSIFEASKIRHTYTNTVSLLTAAQLDSIGSYGASAYSTIHGINGWGNDNSTADLHDGSHHMFVYDVYSQGGMTGGGSNGNGFGFRGRFNEFNNIKILPSRRGGTFFSQYGDSSCAFNTVRNSSFKGWQYAFSVNSGFKVPGIVFDNCTFDIDTTSGDLFDLKNCEITFIRCKMMGSGTNGMRIFRPNENVQITMYDNDIYWPSNLGASRLVWQRGDSLLIYGENNRFHLASALDLLIYTDTTITYHNYGGIYLYNTITNKNVTTIKSTLVDTSFPVKLNLEKRLLNSIPSTSGDFVLTPSSGQVLRFPYYTDKFINVRTLNNANDTISIIDSGNCESQLIRIYNTAGAFNLSLLKNNLTKLTGDTTKIIRPNEFITLMWDKTSSLWREVKNRPQPVVQTATADAGIIISSSTDVLISKGARSAVRSVSTRNPFECLGTELIVIDSTTGGFQQNWSPLVYDPRVNTTVQKIPNFSTTVLRSDGVRWVIQSQVADTLHVNKIRADTLTAGLTRTTYTPRMKFPVFDTAATSQRFYYTDAPFGRTDSLYKVNDSTLGYIQRQPNGTTNSYTLNMQGGHNGGGGGGGSGTNLFTADQTQTANRQHNSADFTFLIDSSKSYTLKSRSQTGTVGDISQFSMLPNSIESRASNGSSFSASTTTITSTVMQSQGSSKFGSITASGANGLTLFHQPVGNIRFPTTNMLDSLVQIGWGTNDITDTTFRVTLGRQHADGANETGVKVYINGQRKTGTLQDSTFFLMREGTSFRARYVSIQDIANKITPSISGMAIGGAIGNSPVSGRSLFVGSDGSLQQSSKFQYDSTNGKMSINGAGTTAVLNVRGTIAQQQLEYDVSNFFTTTVASNGSTSFGLTGTSPLFTFLNGINMNSTVTNGNLWIPNAQATTTSSSSKVAFGGITNTHVRFAPALGSTASTLTANYNYAGVDNGDQAIAEGISGTHRILANTRIGGITGSNNAAATKFMVGLYISTPLATGNAITPDSAYYPLWTEGAPRFDIPGATTGAIYYQGTNGGVSTLNPGTNGQVLTLSGGVPVWQTGGGGGSGTVNSALINQLAYYAGSGTAVSGLPIPTPNRAWVGDANGLPIASATTATQIGYLSTTTGNVQNAIDSKADALPAPNTQSGTTYTLQATDNGKSLYFTSNSAVTLTLPTGLAAGFSCIIWQWGTGTVTFTPAAGVTIRNGDGNTKTAGQYLPASVQGTPTSNTYATGGRMIP